MLMMAGFVPRANADTTYTYTGNDYTSAQSPFTTSDSISGSFTIATLAPSLTNDFITPTSWSFSDGINQYTNINGSTGIFEVTTNAQGAIEYWDVNIENAAGSWVFLTTDEPASPPFFFAQVVDDVSELSPVDCSNCEIVQNDPGTWSSVVPEPSALVLVSSGLLALAFVARKRGRVNRVGR
jgi:hypothetical protein